MGPVAALYDIHGNVPALEAVLAEVRQSSVDLIVVGGDVLPGPMPRETLDALYDLDIPTRFIRGNGDRAVLEALSGGELVGIPESRHETLRWVANQLLLEDEQRISDWPKTIRTTIAGLGDVLFCHATPRNDTEIFTRTTPEERLVPIFEPTGVSLVVCGHTHMQFDRMIGQTRVVNAGSVGMPFGEPAAYWALLGPDVQLRRTAYDLEAAAERIRTTGYPQAREFAAQEILHPRSESEMLMLFAPAELK
jgi:putative phosphoesterase